MDNKLIEETIIDLDNCNVSLKLVGRYIENQGFGSTALPDWTSLEINVAQRCDAYGSTSITINNINHENLDAIAQAFTILANESKKIDEGIKKIKDIEVALSKKDD